MNIVVLYGGRSSEHEISLEGATAVARIAGERHTVQLISISKNGAWYAENPVELQRIKENDKAVLTVHPDEARRVSIVPGGGKSGAFKTSEGFIPTDVAFPLLHGAYGEDGTIQGLLEMADVPYVGCNVLSSAITMDKEITKALCQNAGLPTVPGICITKADTNDGKAFKSKIDSAVETLGFPLFVKPCCAGSSVGASLANNANELSSAIDSAFLWDNKVLVEKAIHEREISCSITGNSITADASKPKTMLASYALCEIEHKTSFLDYDTKYHNHDDVEFKIPAPLFDKQAAEIRDMALKAYSVVNASGFARVDFFMDRNDGKIYLNEINAIPGFTTTSIFPRMCNCSGLGFAELLDMLFDEACAQFEAKSALRTNRTV